MGLGRARLRMGNSRGYSGSATLAIVVQDIGTYWSIPVHLKFDAGQF